MLDALRDWMATTMTQAETDGSELDGHFWERRALRAHIINTEPELRGRARASYYPFERVLAEAIGKDLSEVGVWVGGVREDEERGAELRKLVDRVIRFARAGIDGAR